MTLVPYQPTALITGVSGQDGRYLTTFLLRKGYKVVGLTRNRVSAELTLAPEMFAGLELLECRLEDFDALSAIIEKIQPQEIYNFAALSSGAKMFDEPNLMLRVNSEVVISLLESVRLASPSSKLFQASSREVFGLPKETPQNEDTARCPRSPYGAAKLYADNLIEIYRNSYGIFCCSGFFFNHESPYRREEFVSRKITRGAARISLGLEKELVLGSLDSVRDWAHAADIVEGAWLALQQEKAQDFVFATGVPHTVRELCEVAFSCVGLNYMDYCRSNPDLLRAEEDYPLVGDSAKAFSVLGWKPRISFRETIEEMVRNDLQIVERAGK